MIAEKLRVLVVQPDIAWNDTCKNLESYSSMLAAASQPVDLIVFPEMFTTGFILTPEQVDEKDQEATINWMKDLAVNRGCSVAGSLVFSEDNRFFNRLVCVHETARMDVYDKRHLFRMEGENKRYVFGKTRSLSVIKGWRICWQICYDLRFPVWSRNRRDYDVLINAANWPAKRSDVWNALLKARAIENQAYVIGVNRVGEDENSIAYIGESMVISPKGTVIQSMDPGKARVMYSELIFSELSDFRVKFPVLDDADPFTLE